MVSAILRAGAMGSIIKLADCGILGNMTGDGCAENIDVRTMDDEHFLRHCRWEAFRGPGPGGQKRNKTSSSVRIVHEPTGLIGIAGESRSQAENRAKALGRLRHRLVLEVREPIEPEGFDCPEWFAQLVRQAGRLRVPRRGKDYLRTLGLVLDALCACGWSISEAGRLLNVSTAGLAAFLAMDEKAMAKVNQYRAERGLKPLRP